MLSGIIRWFLAGALLMQAPGVPQQDQPMVLRISTHLVVVDAVIHDQNGAIISDLKQDDFKVYENGKLQDVRIFSFQDGSTPTDSPREAKDLPENVYTNRTDLKSPGRPPTVLLIDSLNTPMSDQINLKSQLIKFIESRKGDDNVAVFLLGNRLRVLQDFTSDPEVLRTVIRKFAYEGSPVGNEHPDDSVDDALSRDFGNLGDIDPDMLQALRDFMDHRITGQTDMRASITLDAFRRIARLLAGFRGRKNLVWLSAAFPQVVTSEMTGMVANNYLAEMRRTTNILSDSQVAIYPVDVRGLVNNLLPDITLAGRTTLANPLSTPAMEAARRNAAVEDARGTMVTVADNTGGRVYKNRNDIGDAVANSIDDGAVYYTLGYYPADANWDGKFRKIEVKVARKGVQVRARNGYYATDPQKSSNDNARAAEFLDMLTPGSPKSTSIPFKVKVELPASDAPDTSILFNVDPHYISFTKLDSGLQHAELHFVVRAFDAQGKLVTSDAKIATANMKPESFERLMAEAFPFEQKLHLTPGKYRLEVGVRDIRSFLTGTLSASIDIPRN